MQQVTTSTDANPTTIPLQEGIDPLQFYEQIVSLVPGILYVFNHQMQTNEYSNNSIGALLGYSPEEVLEMGENVMPSLIHADDLPRLGRYFETLKTLEDGATTGIEYRAIARDGSTVWLRSNDAVFQRDAQGNVLRHIGVSNDVTEQVTKSLSLAKMNKTLEERTDQLERTNEELEQLAYIATHDLKGPLSNLSHLVNVFEEELADASDDVKDILGWMQSSCAQANEKLSALVRVAEVRSGELSPPVRVDLAQTTRNALQALEREVETAGATVHVDFSAAAQVDFPQFEVSSILENLISNAIRYADPARPPQIQITSAAAEGAVQLCVRDNGRGLSLPQDAEKVFGLFKRAHVEPAGSGIALYTVRKMLQRFGGDIEVESVKDEGAAFTLTFPHQEGTL